MKTNSKTMNDLETFANDGRFCAVANLRQTARAATRYYDQIMSGFGYRSTQFSILMRINRVGPLTVNKLAEMTILDRTSLSRNLKPLERDRLIEINPGEDRRERELKITDKGRRVMERGFGLWKKAQKTLVKRIGVDRFQRILDDLQAIVRAVKEH